MASKAQAKKLSIFISYSQKDIEKVRKVRDVLETINCEPILLYLVCLDEKQDELEDLIKREIDARNIFIYCKSKNSERSKWVRKEKDYIEQSKKNRIYEIDLEESFESSVVAVLNEIMKIVQRNTVTICRDKAVAYLTHFLQIALEHRGFLVQQFDPENERDRKKKVDHFCGNGIFVPVVYRTKDTNSWSYFVGKEVLDLTRKQKNALYVPVLVSEEESDTELPVLQDGVCVLEEDFLMGISQIVERIVELSEGHPKEKECLWEG